ncbi:hypothetical protein INT43_003505 [Umbelopsis isabellina]|uniref:Uncharacterized protein n=1 Tax=Mortierella isabellina TaxID=91625 RepID=A0A8H7UE53_MORIS|nr:hypothetical protein INT43_003505 [Umbelopsis isabellina]
MSHESSERAQIEEGSESDGAVSGPLLEGPSSRGAAENSLKEKHLVARHEFRKMRKLQRRKAYRQAKALERQERRRKKLVEEESQRDRYDEQRNMWLAKEAMFDKISTAKQKAREIEAEAARNMKASVDRAVSSIALPPKRPMYTAAKKETSYKAPQIPNMPNFVRSQNNLDH